MLARSAIRAKPPRHQRRLLYLSCARVRLSMHHMLTVAAALQLLALRAGRRGSEASECMAPKTRAGAFHPRRSLGAAVRVQAQHTILGPHEIKNNPHASARTPSWALPQSRGC